MRWQKVRLEELIYIKHGFAFKSQFFSDSGRYMLLTPGNCYESGGLRLRGGKEKFYQGEVPEEYLLSSGDLLVVMTDLVNTAPILGGAFFIPEDDQFLHNQRLGLVKVKDADRLDKDFLYYLLNSRGYRAQVRGSASGATVRHTSPGRIGQCNVNIPQSVREQGRIASLLSSYDSLVANNQRRIQLLEESARLLYKEWFVHLRFPGHEHVKVTNGVPEGWERLLLGDLITLQRGFDLPVSKRVEGEVPVYASTGITGYHAEAKVSGPGVVTGRSGSLGQVMYVSSDYWPLNTTLWVKEFKKIRPHFARHLLAGLHLEKYNGGAAVPTLNRNDVHRIQVLLPPPMLLSLFEEQAMNFYQQVDVLTRTNDRLAKARDLLLPKLMSGELAA